MYHFILKVSAEFRIPEHTQKYNIDNDFELHILIHKVACPYLVSL